jgi:hypothetical protein
MKIKSNIDVYANGELIANCDNLITNKGKEIFLDWLSHKTYVNCDSIEKPSAGLFLSNGRFLTNNDGLVFSINNFLGETKATITNQLIDFCNNENY